MHRRPRSFFAFHAASYSLDCADSSLNVPRWASDLRRPPTLPRRSGRPCSESRESRESRDIRPSRDMDAVFFAASASAISLDARLCRRSPLTRAARPCCVPPSDENCGGELPRRCDWRLTLRLAGLGVRLAGLGLRLSTGAVWLVDAAPVIHPGASLGVVPFGSRGSRESRLDSRFESHFESRLPSGPVGAGVPAGLLTATSRGRKRSHPLQAACWTGSVGVVAFRLTAAGGSGCVVALGLPCWLTATSRGRKRSHPLQAACWTGSVGVVAFRLGLPCLLVSFRMLDLRLGEDGEPPTERSWVGSSEKLVRFFRAGEGPTELPGVDAPGVEVTLVTLARRSGLVGVPGMGEKLVCFCIEGGAP